MIIVLIRLLMSLNRMGKVAKITISKADVLNEKVQKASASADKINETINRSIPLFVGVLSIMSFINLIKKDLNKSDKTNRSIARSSIKAAMKRPNTFKKIQGITKSF